MKVTNDEALKIWEHAVANASYQDMNRVYVGGEVWIKEPTSGDGYYMDELLIHAVQGDTFQFQGAGNVFSFDFKDCEFEVFVSGKNGVFAREPKESGLNTVEDILTTEVLNHVKIVVNPKNGYKTTELVKQ